MLEVGIVFFLQGRTPISPVAPKWIRRFMRRKSLRTPCLSSLPSMPLTILG